MQNFDSSAIKEIGFFLLTNCICSHFPAVVHVCLHNLVRLVFLLTRQHVQYAIWTKVASFSTLCIASHPFCSEVLTVHWDHQKLKSTTANLTEKRKQFWKRAIEKFSRKWARILLTVQNCFNRLKKCKSNNFFIRVVFRTFYYFLTGYFIF